MMADVAYWPLDSLAEPGTALPCPVGRPSIKPLIEDKSFLYQPTSHQVVHPNSSLSIQDRAKC